MTKDRPAGPPGLRGQVLPLALFLGAPLLLIVLPVVLVMYHSPLVSSVDDRIVFGDGQAGEVVIVTYEREGDRNPLALPHWILSGYDRRAAAFSTATGEQLWDVSVDRWWPQGETGPLAEGGGRVYVVVADGLVILDAADGGRVAGPDEIDGLAQPVLEAQGAYGYDAETDQVVALTADGDIVGIPVGADAATPVGRDVLDRWSARLDTGTALHEPDDGRPSGNYMDDGQCEEASDLCAVSPSGVVVEVEPAGDTGSDGDMLESVLVGGARTELGTQGLWW